MQRALFGALFGALFVVHFVVHLGYCMAALSMSVYSLKWCKLTYVAVVAIRKRDTHARATQARFHAFMHTHTNERTHARTHARTHIHIHTQTAHTRKPHTQVHTHARTRRHAHARVHTDPAHAHVRTNTHAHAHTRTHRLVEVCAQLCSRVVTGDCVCARTRACRCGGWRCADKS